MGVSPKAQKSRAEGEPLTSFGDKVCHATYEGLNFKIQNQDSHSPSPSIPSQENKEIKMIHIARWVFLELGGRVEHKYNFFRIQIQITNHF